MAQNIQIDPTKRDYVIVNGSPVPSDRIEDKAYIAIQIPQNQWLYGTPTQGSLIYTLQNKKHSPSIEQRFATYATGAINRQLITPGDATAVNVNNIQVTPTGTLNRIQVVPNTALLSNQFAFNQV